ncbi:DUF1064 domain-containing protein [Pseudooceanicola atlanticus]|uniref:DUF1064 domain-containing protein n=1 Tax=Pseudooceanicola atlanticus TaxID=1461694 RepID=UPI0023524D47|nr:DUF1064 domain-containing protein [Pseudooceanicola atlanticus]
MQRTTLSDLRKMQDAAADKRRVRGAQPITIDGIRFDSKREARRWQDLKLLEAAGEITDLERQVAFPLNGAKGPILTPTGKQAFYFADFRYRDNRLGGAVVVEDAKGHPTDSYLLKKAILAADGVTIEEV